MKLSKAGAAHRQENRIEGTFSIFLLRHQIDFIASSDRQVWLSFLSIHVSMYVCIRTPYFVHTNK